MKIHNKEKTIIVKITHKSTGRFFFAQTSDPGVYLDFLFKDIRKTKGKNSKSIVYKLKQLIVNIDRLESEITIEEFKKDNYLKAKEFLINCKNENKNNPLFIQSELGKSPKNTRTRRIMIDDVIYKTKREASEKLNIPEARISKRLKSKNWNNFVYIDPPFRRKKTLSM